MKPTYHTVSPLRPTSAARTISLPAGWRVWLVERLLARLRRAHARRLALPRHLWRQGRLSLVGVALALSLSGMPAGAAPLAAPQGEIVVTTSNVTPTDDAECGLVEAIIAANTDLAYFGCAAGSGADTIVLSGNTYSFTAPYGGGHNALPFVTTDITIDGNGSTIERTGGPNFRLIRVSGPSGDLTLNDATLSGGAAADGGAMYVHDGANITLNNSTLSNNLAANYGGGLYANNGASAVLHNSTISGNDGEYGGGITALDGSYIALNESSVSGNTITAAGGGVALLGGSTLLLNDSSISGNSAIYNGGGVFSNFGSTVTLNNSDISTNTTNYGGGGIALFHEGATLTINNSTVSDNSGTYAAGLFIAFNVTVTIESSTISDNTSSSGNAGGMTAANESTVTVNNSTISGNSTAGGNGGGLRIRESSLEMTNSTLTGNSAGGNGGGLYAHNQSSVTITQSIVSGNRATGDGNEIFDADGTATSLGYNVLGDAGETGAEAFDNFTPHASDFVATSDQENVALGGILQTDGSDAPLLANNGGPTETIALVPGSPAIDHAPDGPPTDQRGFARPVDGDGNPSANEYDAGAFEYDAGPPTAVTLGAVTVQPGTGGFTGPLTLLIALLSLLGFQHRRR